MAGTTIFYFTGTGNSLKVAKDLASHLGDAELVQISKRNMAKTGDVYAGKIGIVFPVYFSGLPHMVKRFAELLKVTDDAYVFAVATYGGGSGFSLEQLSEILGKRSITLSAAFGILMPGNYQVLYAPAPENKQKEYFQNEQDIVTSIARRVTGKEKIPPPRMNLLKFAFFGLIYGRLKPNDRDRHFYADENCNGCGVCARICPAGNVEILGGRPVWNHRCEYCLACLQWCPQKAIQYKKKTVRRGRYHHPDIGVKELFQEEEKELRPFSDLNEQSGRSS